MPRTTVQKNSNVRANPKRTPTISSSRAFGQKSPIVDKDIQHFLAHCMNSWDSYTDEEKQGIIQSLPPTRRSQGVTSKVSSSQSASNSLHANHGVLGLDEAEDNNQASNKPPVPADIIASDTYVKRAVARFKRDITDGYYEKTWQDKATRAYEERKQGKFDGYLSQCAEEMFSPSAEESEESDYGEYESDEDYVVGTQKGCKKSRADADKLPKAQKVPSRPKKSA